MIIKAKVVWEVPVTLDVDNSQPRMQIEKLIRDKAFLKLIAFDWPKITECNELPEIVDKPNKEPI